MSHGGSATGSTMMMMLDIPDDNLDFFDEDLRLNDYNETLDESGFTDTLSSSRVETPASSEGGNTDFPFVERSGSASSVLPR